MQILAVLSKSCDGGHTAVKRCLKLQTRHMTDEAFESNISKIAEYPRQTEWTDAVDGEHVIQGSGIVGENHRSALTGSPPQAVLAE